MRTNLLFAAPAHETGRELGESRAGGRRTERAAHHIRANGNNASGEGEGNCYE